MAGVATHLADKSALARMRHPDVAARVAPLLGSGVLATCSIMDLEVLYSASDGREHQEWRADRASAYELIPIEQPMLERAVEVQGMLAQRGTHRGAPVADLIIAAAAERAGVTLLHYDADFDLIASVTGQRCQWVVERGTVDQAGGLLAAGEPALVRQHHGLDAVA
ncbi:MAG TPA: PIN domain nuclease [Solirubrobacteraceae bacterium]|nr:PIN domain nuclease [Solirubrobacteraceae bacterium]